MRRRRIARGIRVSGVLLLLLAAIPACSRSPEAARRKLASDGIALTPAEFVRRAATDPWPALELFLVAGMDPNIKADVERLENVTALMVASRAGREEIARRLHESGADVNAQTRQGETALMYAASAGRPGVVRYLLRMGADVNQGNRRGETPLLLSIPAPWPQQDQERALDCINQLLAAGALVNSRSADGATALHAAIGRDQLPAVRLLLLRGADPNLSGGTQNISPLRHAIEAEAPEIARALLRAGANPTEPGLWEAVHEGLRTNGTAMREALSQGGVSAPSRSGS